MNVEYYNKYAVKYYRKYRISAIFLMKCIKIRSLINVN